MNFYFICWERTSVSDPHHHQYTRSNKNCLPGERSDFGCRLSSASQRRKTLAEDAEESAGNGRRDAAGLQQSGGQHLPQLGAGANRTVGGGTQRRVRLAVAVESLHGKV
jgi:hypothetical protein